MKANEAPEKLYMNWVNYPLEEMQVEYTRTDAFIDKACDFISSLRKLDDDVIDEFKKYMKGE